jgi:hypothetical protein
MADWRSIRASIEHENQLVNYRFTWLLGFETILFTALGFIAKEFPQCVNKNNVAPLGLYCFVLTGFVNVGIIAALYVERYIRGAESAHEALVRWWWYRHKDMSLNSDNPPLCGGPNPIVSLKKFELKPSKNLFDYLIAKFTRQSRYPLLFVLVWLSFNYTVLKYSTFSSYKTASLLAKIAWWFAILLPPVVLIAWIIIYLFQRREVQEYLSPKTAPHLVSATSEEALKNRAKPNGALMQRWFSAGWSGAIAVLQSLLKSDHPGFLFLWFLAYLFKRKKCENKLNIKTVLFLIFTSFKSAHSTVLIILFFIYLLLSKEFKDAWRAKLAFEKYAKDNQDEQKLNGGDYDENSDPSKIMVSQDGKTE